MQPTPPDTPCLHTRFAAQAARTPDAPAVLAGETRLTYRELDTRANQLAWRLQACGVGPDTLVGLYLERSAALVIAVLATLKAGAAYLPIDPLYPPERSAFMLTDAHAPVLITQSDLRNQLPAALPPHVLDLTDPAEQATLAALPTTAPPTTVTPDNLAYVIYTSGSTGRPKGTMLAHSAVLRLFIQTETLFDFSPHDVWTLFHSVAFDFSVWEMWGAWLCGACLVVVPYWISRSPEAFYAFIGDTGVTVLSQTPSAFLQLMYAAEAAPRAADLALRYIFLGGEALEFHSLKPWFARRDDRHPQVINGYGITETAVVSTQRWISAADVDHADRNLIGTPFPDTPLYLLDATLHPVTDNTPGELCIGGPSLARGYFQHPALTAQRFVPDPFSATPGARLYRSGDLAHRRADGEIEYLGRIDQQVKLRGFRIELGEIEARLNQHPAVRASAVVVHTTTDANGAPDQRLIAYLIVKQTSPTLHTDLRAHLAADLPAYMLPTQFITLDAFPLSPSGKLDRKALPAPTPTRPTLTTPFVAPHPGPESDLAALWSTLLAVTPIGRHDSFFELGGHSLLATRCIAALQQRFAQSLPLQMLYAAPTVAELAPLLAAPNADAPISQHATYPTPDTVQAEPPTLPAHDAATLAAANDALAHTLLATPVDTHYACGIHQRWYLKEGVRMAVLAEVALHGVPAPAALAQALSTVLTEQPLLRSHLERVADAHDPHAGRFVEHASVALTTDALPLLDLSDYAQTAHLAYVRATRAFLEQRARAQPMAEHALFQLAILRHDTQRYTLVFAFDHIIADRDCTWIITRHLNHALARARGDDEAPPWPGTHGATFADFVRATAPSSTPALIATFKHHPLCVDFMESVALLQTRYPIGETILCSAPYLLELTPPTPSSNTSAYEPVELALHLADRVCRLQFALERVPLRVLTSRRHFGGQSYHYVLGDFHDSLPVCFTAEQASLAHAYQHLRAVEAQLSLDGVYPSGMGVDETIYQRFFLSPFNFNYIGELTPAEEAATLASAKPLSFVSYPIMAYTCGARTCLLLFHGLSTATHAALDAHLATLGGTARIRPTQA